MKKNILLSMALLLFVLLIASACEAPYPAPPATFGDTDLVGIWEAQYGRSVDRLIVKADGTFRQVYRDGYKRGYVYETPWNRWWVERFPDGRIRLHLQGARYYLAGTRTAEFDGMSDQLDPDRRLGSWYPSGPHPFAFYDPYARELLHMVGELVLNVRINSSGELILHHMWTSSDRGFAIFRGGKEVFRRIEMP